MLIHNLSCMYVCRNKCNGKQLSSNCYAPTNRKYIEFLLGLSSPIRLRNLPKKKQ